ncbi:MAG: alpha-glucosidase [Tenericutes bacterium]|nr:alpha-glucosidase [Mycoplasmatota bacterium]
MIKKINNGFEIYKDELLLIRHTEELPAFYLGSKDLTISMKNGEFDIEDSTVYHPLINYKISKNRIVFDELNIALIETEDKLLHLEFSNTDKPLKILIQAKHDEKIFGCGEHFTSLNLRGHMVKNLVEEHITRKQIYNKILRRIFGLKPKKWKFEEYKTYFVSPTYISTNNYFLHAETNSYGRLDFTSETHHELTFLTMPKELVIGKEDNLLELSAMLTKQRGIMPKLPDWIYDGMILAIQGGTKICDEKLTKMLDRGAKVCGIWSQDWCGELFTMFGKQVLWNWEENSALYPNLEAFIQKWNKLGVKFLTYINPYLNANELMYQEASTKNYLVKNKDGSDFLTKATTFDFGIVDLTNPIAYDWYKDIIKNNYLKLGIMGWMADFGEYLPFECDLANGTGEQMHNTWPDLWIQLNREVLEETNMLGKAIFFNRAGYKDNVKYSTLIWNGDQHVDFSDDFGMGSVVRSTLSLSLSGVGITHSDVGGYTTVPKIKRTKELFIRWMEMNTFTPVLRGHEGNKPWVNTQFDSDDQIIDMTVKFTNIHVRLKPYLLSVENEYQTKGYPMMRPTFMYYDLYTDQCFLLGSDLLVCPVIKKRAKKMLVSIPSNSWVHLFTGVVYNKGKHIIEVPLGTPPVFYKSESLHKSTFENITEYILSV